MKNAGTLRKKSLVFSIAVVLVPMVILYLILLSFFNLRFLRENQRYTYFNIQSISHALDSALSGLNEMSLYLIANSSVRSYMVMPDAGRIYAQVNASMQFLPFSSKYYNMVSVFSQGQQTLHSGPYVISSLSDAEKTRADALRGGGFWSLSSGDLSLVRLMRDTNRLSSSLGYIKVQANQAELLALLASPEDLPKTSYLVLCDSGVMLTSGNVPPSLLKSDALRFDRLIETSVDSALLNLDGEVYRYSSRPIVNGKVAVVSLTNQAELYRMDGLLVASISVAALMSAFFVIVLVRYYTSRVFGPIMRLGEEMTNIENRGFKTDFTLPGNSEITVLVEQFQLMCKRIAQMHEQVNVSELKCREAELAVLQSEINPHFLYNTLDTIYWMSEMSSTWKISEMVRSLSTLFRIALQKTVDGLAPLSLEREYMQCYLTIQQVRYQDRIRFSFYVQENLEDQQVLKLLLQPLVENAILHGAEPAGGGRVVINIYREAGEIVYKVFNDGAPVDIPALRRMMHGELNGRRGLALYNISERIRLRFGADYGLQFENPAGGGVLATVRQPATWEVDAHD